MTDTTHYGPTIPISEEIHAMKYRSKGETFKEAMTRVADALKDSPEHFNKFRDILLDMRFLPAGRVQSAIGAPREVTPYNCFVSGIIEDDMNSIMARAGEAAQTMRLGGGIGYDFSRIRPRKDLISTLDSQASGPVSFMGIYDAVCKTIASAGHRRGAQMAVLRVDHPDIEEFIEAKTNQDNLTQFNISVGITDEFMACLFADKEFPLTFNGRVYKRVRATKLWDKIMRNTWDWAEPGVLFIDRMNARNNLWYCETIEATNPCAEQPLPPYGACLLGSFNLTKYIKDRGRYLPERYFDWNAFKQDIPHVVRAMDNIVDRAIYPLPEQQKEAQSKRRMGLGITGLANASAAQGWLYGTEKFYEFEEEVLKVLRDSAYWSSVELAIEKGPFPEFSLQLLESEFAQGLPEDLRSAIFKHGLRNSHLTSIAPTGTISLSADNVSSGIEPVFSHYYDRTIQTFDGPRVERVEDYAYREFGIKDNTANTITVQQHVRALTIATKYVDSAVSKTCNVGDDVTWEEFKNVYLTAYRDGAVGCTTFRASGKRFGILNATTDEDVAAPPEEPKDELKGDGACYFDPNTGMKSCDQ